MKPFAFVCLSVLSVLTTLAQVRGTQATQRRLTREEVVERVCRAPEIRSGPEFDEVQRIERKLAPVVNRDRQRFTTIALVNSNVVNAWATNFTITNSLICVPVAMVHFMGDAEGELAFIMSHEIGHTVDDQCKTVAGRAQIGQAAAPLRSFLELCWVVETALRRQHSLPHNEVVKHGLTLLVFTFSLFPATTHSMPPAPLADLKCIWEIPAPASSQG
jgi:Zn-dependent protease with chaperone function